MRCKADSDAIILLVCPCVLPHSVYGPRMSTPALWLPPIFTPSPTSLLSFQNMIEFQLQRETPSSTMGFGFFEAGVGSLWQAMLIVEVCLARRQTRLKGPRGGTCKSKYMARM